MSTSEDQPTYSAQEAVVPSYDPAYPYPVLDTAMVPYDYLVLGPLQGMAVVPPRGY